MRTLKQTRHGPMLFVPHDKWIGESLLHYGEFSPVEVAHLLALVDRDSVVLDIGANIGCLTVPLARKAGAVWAFEPQRLPFQLLCANIALNNLENVMARQQAVGSKSDVVALPQVHWHKPVNSGGTALSHDEKTGENTRIIIVDELALSACHLIKADVEGLELEVVKGAAETIRAHRPVLYLEADRNEIAPDLIATVKGMGYAAFWDITPLYFEGNYQGNPHNAFPGIVSINLLCLPVERPLPDAFAGLPEARDGENFLKLRARV